MPIISNLYNLDALFPTYTSSDVGKMLAVNSSGTGYELVDAPEWMPPGGTAGQVLSKTEDGTAWTDPPSGGGLPSSGTPYQQLVTDGSGNAKWEDRIAYETDPVLTEVVPESTVTFSDMDGVMGASWPSDFNCVFGQMYTIRMDGVEYSCECMSFESTPVLGNLFVAGVGPDTGEPFLMVNQGTWNIICTGSASEHTVAIYKKESTYVTVPENLLPLTVFSKAEWNSVSGRPIDRIELNETIGPDTKFNKTILPGSVHIPNVHDIDLQPGYFYRIDGTIKISYSSVPNAVDTLSVSGFFPVDEIGGLRIKLGVLHASYWHKDIDVYIVGANSPYYGGMLGLSSSMPATSSTVTVNLNFSDAFKQIDERYIPPTIQRVGDELIIPSSTPGSSKMFKVAVDDATNDQSPVLCVDGKPIVGLPTVTSADDGKLLQVINGEWAAVDIGSAVELLAETGVAEPVTDGSAILTDANGIIYVL